MTAKEHNRLIGIFLMINGGMQALVMLILGLIYGILGAGFAVIGRGEERFVGLIFIGVVVVLLAVSVLFLAPQIIGGWKMFKEKPNAKIWGIIGSILSCLNFPLGTAAGVYGLWFLFGEYGKQFYDNPASPNYLGAMNTVNDFQNNQNREYEPHVWK